MTVTLIALPAIALDGALTVKDAAGPALTATAALVPGVSTAATSVAVTVRDPAVRSVTRKVAVPATSEAFAGSVASASELVMATVGTAEVTRFQLASTALTVALTGAPAITSVGLPVLPDPVPGAAVSPGSSTWSLVTGPGVSVRMAVAAIEPSVRSVAVMVSLPALFDAVIVALYTPLPLSLTAPMVTSPEVVMVTVLPGSPLPKLSVTVASAVDVETPSAVRVCGVRTRLMLNAAAGFTVMAPLVPLMELSAVSVAVIVRLPAVLSTTAKMSHPWFGGRSESAGSTAAPSVLVKVMVPA